MRITAIKQRIIENAVFTAQKILIEEGEKECKAYLDQWARFPDKVVFLGIFAVFAQYLSLSTEAEMP